MGWFGCEKDSDDFGRLFKSGLNMTMAFLTDKAKKAIHFLNGTDGTLRKKTIRSGFWVGVSSLVTNTLAFVRSIVLARLLMPEIFGLMTIASIAIRSLETFTQAGLESALIHRQKSFEEARDTTFTLLVVRGFMLALITFIVSPLVAIYYERPVLETIIKIIAITFILKGFRNINTIACRKELDFKRLAYFEQAAAVISFVIVVTLAYFLRSIWALVIAQVAGSFMEAVMSFVIIPGRPRFRFDKKIAKELFGYGKFVTGLAIVVFISSEIDNALVGKVLGMNALGYYVMAYTLANLPASHITNLVSKIMLPAYSKLQSDLPALRNAYLKVLRTVATLALPVAAGMLILSHDVVLVVYGEKWLPAVAALQVLVIYGLLRSIQANAGPVFFALGKPNIPFYINMVRLSLIAVSIYPLTKAYGIVGTAISVTATIILLQFLAWHYLTAQLRCSFATIFKELATPVISTLGMCATLLLIDTYALWSGFHILKSVELFLNIFVGFIAYTLIYIIVSLHNGEVEFFKSLSKIPKS
ncbi:MAG: lipopolysaccharide biosynthesis protein [Thermodesulfobacteriota bacterium]|nr:lipopolysaccharide biosynthesis protein [Thermodesulfobacteriota bacterium]